MAIKTVTRYLIDEQYERYRPWFGNARQARDPLAELEAASLSVVDTEITKAKGRPGTVSAAKRVKPARSDRA